MNQPAIRLSTSLFFTGANQKLKNSNMTLLLSEIYTRGLNSSCIEIDVEYYITTLGVSATSIRRYLEDFSKLKLLQFEKTKLGYIVEPNISNIEKYLTEGDKQLIDNLTNKNISYKVLGGVKEPKKTAKPVSKQRTLFNIRKSSHITNKWLSNNVEVKTYKNLVLKGTTFTGKDKLYYSLSKLDKAISTGNYNELTPTDFTRFYMIIYEEIYNMKYPTSFRDVQKMKVFLDTAHYNRSELIDLFSTVIERYRTLGYSKENKNFPTLTIGMLKTDWLMNNLLNNIPKGSPKQDGIYRFEETSNEPDEIVDEEF